MVWGWFSGQVGDDAYKRPIDGLVRVLQAVIRDRREAELAQIPVAPPADTAPPPPAPAASNPSAGASRGPSTSAARAAAATSATARARPQPASPAVAAAHARALGTADSLPGGNFWGAEVPPSQQLLLATERGLWEPCFGVLSNQEWFRRFGDRTSRKVILPRVRSGTRQGGGACWVQVRRLHAFDPELLGLPVPAWVYL